MFDQNEKKSRIKVSNDKRKRRIGTSHRSLSDLLKSPRRQKRAKR